MKNLLIVILHDISCLPDLLAAWKKIGVPGVTIMESIGGFQAEKLLKRSGLSALLNIFDQTSETQRFIFSLINDQDTLDQAISEADRVVGGFDRPNSGILFTLPVGQTLGLQKRRQNDIDPVDIKKPDEEDDNLLSWFEEEIKEQFGVDFIKEWESKKKTPVTSLIKDSLLKPIITPTVSSIDQILELFKNNPEMPIICVINSEERLVGLIEAGQLLEMKLIPAMPKNFIQDPQGYEKALLYVQKYSDYLAADVMGEPFYVQNDGNLEDAFTAFSSSKLHHLPVVNKHYRVKGIISIFDLLKI